MRIPLFVARQPFLQRQQSAVVTRKGIVSEVARTCFASILGRERGQRLLSCTRAFAMGPPCPQHHSRQNEAAQEMPKGSRNGTEPLDEPGTMTKHSATAKDGEKCDGASIAQRNSALRRPIAGEDAVSMDTVVAEAVEVLSRGGVIAVPTDTLYGVACRAQSVEGIERIYEIKGRDAQKPVAVCVHDTATIPSIAELTADAALFDALLPGPVTVVLPRKPALNPALNPATSLIGIRVLDLPLFGALTQSLGEPLALTSANLSGEPSCINVSEFLDRLDGLGLIVDGGEIVASGRSRLGSTVVDLSVPGEYAIIRDGSALEETVATMSRFGLVERATEGDK